MSEQEEQIIRKVQPEEKHPNTSHVRFYCPICLNELMWTIEFSDVASATVVETADCKHYEWITTRYHPQYSGPGDWRYKLERPLIESVKDRIVYVYPEVSKYYILLKKISKRS